MAPLCCKVMHCTYFLFLSCCLFCPSKLSTHPLSLISFLSLCLTFTLPCPPPFLSAFLTLLIISSLSFNLHGCFPTDVASLLPQVLLLCVACFLCRVSEHFPSYEATSTLTQWEGGADMGLKRSTCLLCTMTSVIFIQVDVLYM